MYEEKAIARTYLIIDEDRFPNNFFILGYFSITMKTLKFIDGISKSEIKLLHGLDKNKDEILTYLIGQLAKNDNFKDKITGKEILDYCIGVILKAYHVIGGRVALIECADTKKLIDFYTDYGFTKLQNNEHDLVQPRKLIC